MTPDRARPLAFDALQRVDRACTRFEQTWRSGPRPDLRDYLAGTGDERVALFCDLLKVELACRLKRGELPAAEEYRQRFPEDEGAIAAAFEDVRRQQAHPDEGSGGRPTASLGTPLSRGAAAAPPAPLPKVRRASQAMAGIVRVPQAIETKVADRSLTPSPR